MDWFNKLSRNEQQEFFQRVYAEVRRIPPGKVATYGQIAVAVTGAPIAARTVGWALRALPRGSDVPWQRVVNAQGSISTAGTDQRRLLEAEGIEFGANDKIDLKRFGWSG